MTNWTPAATRAWYAIGWTLFGLSIALMVAACIVAAITGEPLILLSGAVGAVNAVSCYTQLKRGL